ncbi:hypothetical protein [Streptomyces narbonensis]
MPNIPETLVAFLATASIGAVWAACAPEFGPRSVVDRFAQLEPKVLLTVAGYHYGERDVYRDEVAEIAAQLPTRGGAGRPRPLRPAHRARRPGLGGAARGAGHRSPRLRTGAVRPPCSCCSPPAPRASPRRSSTATAGSSLST